VRSAVVSRYGPTTRGSVPPSWAPRSVEVSVRRGSTVAAAVGGREVPGGAESAMVLRSGVVRAIRRPVCADNSRTVAATPLQSRWVAA
jgi:hypothetical protein